MQGHFRLKKQDRRALNTKEANLPNMYKKTEGYYSSLVRLSAVCI